MCEVVSCDANATADKPPAELTSLIPPDQRCDEPLPPYKITPPVYRGHFIDTCPQIDAVRHRHSYITLRPRDARGVLRWACLCNVCLCVRPLAYFNKSSVVAETGDRCHNRHRPKRGRGLLCPFRGELRPRLIQCGPGRGLLPYQVASSSIQPFGHNRHEPKTRGCAPFSESCDPI